MPHPEAAPDAEERIRKIFAKDVKVHDAVHTVFRATRKELHTSRAGKKFLALTLVDRTGEVDGRIFDNVEAADGAFANDDYLLVKGKVGVFHGKPQLVVERLERLDPEPIDPKEFTFVAPPQPAAAEEKPERAEKPRKTDEVARELKLPRRVRQLLEVPQVAQAFEALLGYVERMVDERVAARLGQAPERAAEPRPEKTEKKRDRGPRPEHRERPEVRKVETKRDPTLPEGLAFKPFKQLVGEEAAAPAAEAPAAPSTESGTTGA